MNRRKNNPIISIIIPSYNRAHLIGRAIKSVLNQTYQEFELIIVDDASKDNTEEIVKSFNDKRIIYIRHKTNKGAQAARNTAIYASQNEWIAFLDSDDEWLPNRLEAGLAIAHKTDFSVIHSECFIKKGRNNNLKIFGIPHKSGYLYKNLLKWPGPMFQGLLVKRKCLEDIGYLDENIISYQEWDTSIRLARYYNFGYVRKPLFIYHCHEGKTISKDKKRNIDGWAQIVEKHHKDIREIAGKKALQHHYINLALNYSLIKEFEIASKYYYKAELDIGLRKIIYNLQLFLIKMHINPNILDIDTVFKYIIKYLTNFISRKNYNELKKDFK